jgi:4-azaleucine resistance transporter AzlC
MNKPGWLNQGDVRRKLRANESHHAGAFREATLAIRLTIPVAMAYVPLGIAFGILLVTTGINWYWAPLSALLIFAGSIEFLSVSLMASGIPIFQVALTVLVVNFRHIFYGLTFPICRLERRCQNIYGVFALTDETYGITAAGQGARLNGFQITTLQVVSHLWWVSGSLMGSLIGQVVPSSITGFGFALTAMFVTLAVDAMRSSKDYALLGLAVTAGIGAFSADRYIFKDSFIFVGLLIYLV